MAKEIKKIGDILIKRKYITKKQLNNALEEQGDRPLGQTLIEMGYVKDHEITEALEEQSLLKQTLETAKDAVANPIQYKALWFIVAFSIFGIFFIYSQLTGTVDEGIKGNTVTNELQDEDINAVSVKEKKLRLRYIGHNSKLKEIQDTKRTNVLDLNIEIDTLQKVQIIQSPPNFSESIKELEKFMENGLLANSK